MDRCQRPKHAIIFFQGDKRFETKAIARELWMTSIQRPLKQKTIGVLGGMSNEATAEYYKQINGRLNARLGNWDNGEIVIVSVNFGNVEYFVRHGLWDEASKYLEAKVGVLEAAGVDVIVCASNTMHIVVAPIMAAKRTPFIHIAEPTGRAIVQANVQKVALLGTFWTMHSSVLSARLRDLFGIEVIVLETDDARELDSIIFDELVHHRIVPDSKRRCVGMVNKLRTLGAQGLILGCTELFLLLGKEDFPKFPVFDTTILHVNACVDFILEMRQ